MRYTIELNELLSDKNFELFDFNYEFYDEILKPVFETKFKDYFFFHEIGFETVGRFKHQLRTKLNTIMPIYKQLYQSEIEAKKINFLLNKDLKETYVKEIINDSLTDTITNINSLQNLENETINIDSQTPQGKIENIETYMSSANKDTAIAKNNQTSDSSTHNKISGNNKESFELISQGNIGITSSAALLTEWRTTMLNIDKMIFDECNELFMRVY